MSILIYYLDLLHCMFSSNLGACHREQLEKFAGNDSCADDPQRYCLLRKRIGRHAFVGEVRM